MGDEDEHKLYIKANCSMCLGGQREGVFANCPYCDMHRKSYIEASFNIVKTNLSHQLTITQKKELINYLKVDIKKK